MGDLRGISKYVLQELKEGHIDKNTAITLVNKINEREDIAVIGIGCKASGVKNYEDFWNVINRKQTKIKRCCKRRIDLVRSYFPQKIIQDESKFSKGCFMNDIDLFDNKLFHMSEKEAKAMGAEHRLMLETAYQALEDAGMCGRRLKRQKTGVFVGMNFSKDCLFSYGQLKLKEGKFDFNDMLFNWSSGLATRIASAFNLKGPSVVVDASCPSSTLAIKYACDAIRNRECTMAVAGGLLLDLSPIKTFNNTGFIFAHEDNIITKSYDNNPGGGYIGEGSAIFVLKSLSKALDDNDRIHGIICGISHNSNGSDGEYVQSNVNDVKKAFIEVVKETKINADDISYLEGEGYANKLEEGLETAGLIEGMKSFTNKKQFCALGSLTANFGYMQSAIGIFSMIKCIMAMQKSIIPPMYHFVTPTDIVNFCDSPFYVSDISKPWINKSGKKKCSAAYSYGFGGINMVTILSEAPNIVKYEKQDRKCLFILSAVTQYSMNENINSYIDFLEMHEDVQIVDICYSSSVCKMVYEEYRLAIIVKDREDLVYKLKRFKNKENNIDGLYYAEKENCQDNYKKKKIVYQNISGKTLEDIGEAFSTGENFSFEELYTNELYNFCQLPSYVMDKHSYWSVGTENTKHKNLSLMKRYFGMRKSKS